jgi:SAM-dependent methyltransferase
VILVDDVCTTGSTLAAAADALAAGGLVVVGAMVLLLADRACPRIPGPRATTRERSDRDRPASRDGALTSLALGWLPAPIADATALDLVRNRQAHARAGYRVVAADVSRARKAVRASVTCDRSVFLVQMDTEAWPFADESFDAIVQIDFLDRATLENVRRTVRLGGLLLIDTFAGDPLPDRPGPQRTEYRLAYGELAERFGDWDILQVEESPARGRAAILARRPHRRERVVDIPKPPDTRRSRLTCRAGVDCGRRPLVERIKRSRQPPTPELSPVSACSPQPDCRWPARSRSSHTDGVGTARGRAHLRSPRHHRSIIAMNVTPAHFRSAPDLVSRLLMSLSVPAAVIIAVSLVLPYGWRYRLDTEMPGFYATEV